MAALGVMAKIRVPYAHTSLEIVRMRYGRIAHLTFIGLNLVNNVFGCASMIMTGSQLIYGVSGMNFVAATILIPLGGMLVQFTIYWGYGLRLHSGPLHGSRWSQSYLSD
jgi:hypothetical protein